MPDTAPAKRTRRKEARPGELLQAALDLFVEKGYAGTSVEEVARRAGVSKGTLFLYFSSKEELFKAVVRANISGLFTQWNAEMDQFTGSTADLVRHSLQQWWDRMGTTQASGITKLVMTESATFPEIANFYSQEVIEPGNQLIRRLLQRGVDRGEFQAVDPNYGIYAMIAPMIFLVMWKHAMSPCCGPGTELDPLTFVNTQADLLLNGLLVRPAHAAA
jgi:TetR/AcrR family transcriptional regulator